MGEMICLRCHRTFDEHLITDYLLWLKYLQDIVL